MTGPFILLGQVDTTKYSRMVVSPVSLRERRYEKNLPVPPPVVQGPLLLWASFANCFLRSMIGSALAVAQFSLWSLRRRAGLTVPVALAFLLLIGAAQTIGTLHDISSVETQQKIAQSWRPPYDLLIRPQSAVSQLERSMGWIDPQSALESYGGISIQQVGNIRSLPHVAQVVPFANIGWQTVNMQVPVELVSRGIYRVSA